MQPPTHTCAKLYYNTTTLLINHGDEIIRKFTPQYITRMFFEKQIKTLSLTLYIYNHVRQGGDRIECN